MGMESDLSAAKNAFPDARRAIMYNPVELAEKTIEQIGEDLERIAREYGPCDIVFADIGPNIPDNRVKEIIELCEQLSVKHDMAIQ
jgi:hypothetical protein